MTIDKNGDGEIQISEAEIVGYIQVQECKIESLEGIQFFKNLLGFCKYFISSVRSSL